MISPFIQFDCMIAPYDFPAAPPSLEQAEQTGFTVDDSQSIQFTTDTLRHEQLMDLLTMTPHLYRASQKGRDAAQQLPGLAVTADILIRTLTHP